MEIYVSKCKSNLIVYLSRKYGLSTSSFILAKNCRPLVKNGMHISFSYSDEFVYAVMNEKNIAIDVETVKERDYHSIVALFDINERSEINNLYDFYTVWTMKEAFLKFYGIGLLRELDSFNVFSEKNNFYITVYNNDLITLYSQEIHFDNEIVFKKIEKEGL